MLKLSQNMHNIVKMHPPNLKVKCFFSVMEMEPGVCTYLIDGFRIIVEIHL